MKHRLPELHYDYDELEPVIDAKTMQIHHTKHHQGYTDKLNAALERHKDHKAHGDLTELPVEELLRSINTLPDDVRRAVRNNGGGYVNHKLFFGSLTPDTKPVPTNLKNAVTDAFGDWDTFEEAFKDAAKSKFGSGWAWLIVDVEGALRVMSTTNQDSPYMDGYTPLLGIDVWEHAYYLHYQNRRGDYVDNYFDIVDWDVVAERYEATQ